jgi:hypothetical protein
MIPLLLLAVRTFTPDASISPRGMSRAASQKEQKKYRRAPVF